MADHETAAERYLSEHWGEGYFPIDEEGFVCCRPDPSRPATVRLVRVLDELRRRGFRSPFLLRFPQILEHRLHRLHAGFEAAMREFEFAGRYQAVYPVKVNQQRVVVEQLAASGYAMRYGIEAGSKGELVLALSQKLHEESLVLCNGYKDRDYLELAIRAGETGKRLVVTVETMAEVDELLQVASEVGAMPALGFRARLSSRGAGRWQESGGSSAKFGLSTGEILRAMDALGRRGALDRLQLLHYHVGSQISDILAVKEAVREAARLWCHVKRRASNLQFLDVGGGLGVDYDGSSTASDWSLNYDLEEYCRDIVYNIQVVCEEEKLPLPTIVTENGRAVAAHHAVLAVTPVKLIGAVGEEAIPVPEKPCSQVEDLQASLERVDEDTWREMVNDGRFLQEAVLQGFKMGYVSLEDRAAAEALFARICARALQVMDIEEEDPDEIAELRRIVAPALVCNFSVFQSAPDSWALDQVFPVMPLSALDGEDLVPATLGDISCDSDGVIDHFLGGATATPQRTLMVPRIDMDAPYTIGIFLVGAYQDTLGDFHNLFGAANEATVLVDGVDGFRILNPSRGTTVSEALRLFSYDRQRLLDEFDDLHGGDDSPDTIRYRDCFLRVLNSGTYLRR